MNNEKARSGSGFRFHILWRKVYFTKSFIWCIYDNIKIRNMQNKKYRYLDIIRLKFYAKEILMKENETARTIKLRINENKTKTMIQFRRRNGQNITLDVYTVEQVSSFVYMGSLIKNKRMKLKKSASESCLRIKSITSCCLCLEIHTYVYKKTTLAMQ